MGAEPTMWWVNGRAMPSPSKMDWSLQDIHAPNAGRSLDGVMHFTIVTQKRKLMLQFPPGDPSVAATVANAINRPTFVVRYWDLQDNAWRTSTMYKGDRKGGLMIFSSRRKVSEAFSVNLIEI